MQTLQKVEFDNLATFLATINNNFSIIQNSPLFKGVPGEQGVQGETGSQGDRGTKILPVVFDCIKEIIAPLKLISSSWNTISWRCSILFL